jgi:hypothetical protein
VFSDGKSSGNPPESIGSGYLIISTIGLAIAFDFPVSCHLLGANLMTLSAHSSIPDTVEIL